VVNLSAHHLGALIAIERETGLQEYIASGTKLEATISAALIQNVFVTNTPLHDGALIIRGNRLEAAACLLPLSSNDEISKDLGTRHRAAIGLTERSDALVIIVSEETGTISLAQEGKLTRYLDGTMLETLLYNLLHTPQRKGIIKGLLRRER
jgi:diadenylate cyclase